MLIQGPCQQGLCCAMAASRRGANRSSLPASRRCAPPGSRQGARSGRCYRCGEGGCACRVMEITSGRGCRYRGRLHHGSGERGCSWVSKPTKRRGGTMGWSKGKGSEVPGLSDRPLTRKGMTLKSARGHSYSCGRTRAGSPGGAAASAGADDDAPVRPHGRRPRDQVGGRRGLTWAPSMCP